MSHRTEHLASSMQRVIGEILIEGLSDPRICGMVSITQVKVSPDRHYADIHVSVLPQEDQDRTLAGLRSAAGHLRSMVGNKLRVRYVPRLRFHLDESLKKEARILDAIRDSAQSSASAGEDAQRKGVKETRS